MILKREYRIIQHDRYNVDGEHLNSHYHIQRRSLYKGRSWALFKRNRIDRWGEWEYLLDGSAGVRERTCPFYATAQAYLKQWMEESGDYREEELVAYTISSK